MGSWEKTHVPPGQASLEPRLRTTPCPSSREAIHLRLPSLLGQLSTIAVRPTSPFFTLLTCSFSPETTPLGPSSGLPWAGKGPLEPRLPGRPWSPWHRS